jgi:hypothetical protein
MSLPLQNCEAVTPGSSAVEPGEQQVSQEIVEAEKYGWVWSHAVPLGVSCWQVASL